MALFDRYQERFRQQREVTMTLDEYLKLCAKDPLAYASAAERMLAAIGEPRVVDTQSDLRLARIFMNRKILTYPAFEDFYGIEDVVENLVAYFRHAAQGLEERKQILYLLGPVGAAKSSLAERLKALMEQYPIYCLASNGRVSPLYESPLGLFDPEEDGAILEERYGIPRRAIQGVMSPWAAKRLREFDGDIRRFSVVRLMPSQLHQIGITKVEPGDENNQDIASLVGKVDIRKLEDFSQDDPDAYSYAGGLNVTTQGVLEFVEMFKAPIKMLHPLLTATQEGTYNGTEGFGAMPYQGIILAHSNESEWAAFRNNKRNEAFLDRVFIVKVPYCLRVTEETRIYRKLLENSALSQAPCATDTLEMLARFSVLSRLKDPGNSSLWSKMEIYDGKTLKDRDQQAKSLQEYRDVAGVDEGMDGISTRFAYKILSRTFNYDSEEVAANPVHLLHVLETQVRAEQFPPDVEARYLGFLKDELASRYAEFLGLEIQKAYLESYGDYGQNLFDRYIQYADFWLQDTEFRDPDTGQIMNRTLLNEDLEKIEKPAGIANPKDFRNEVVNFVLRAKANNGGKSPAWTSYEKLRVVIEKKMFANTEDLLPVISFGKKRTSEDERKHHDFVVRMQEKGYTEKQVRLLVDWYMRYRKHH
ncbi:PrkA family serine protein kinase [Acidiferrobacter thiooxydans]|jgi:serine protein kinase|uniref:PrkA family serine protein kinase n=1 Tax=Acidiferrobacter thiooxydans TaxID=163359 RepID=A0A368HEQ0_9GAMM|nr:PrkA family serine protein kinase [Acidiferrobacter thiooxydans]RCN55951.1 PrkA family serine protein kinase [Acidiferrobacter thiooxydans]